jgi:UPF0755 protein
MIHNIIAAIFILLVATTLWVRQDYQNAITEAVVPKSTIIEIKRGDSFNSFINQLVKKKVAIKPIWFKLRAYQLQATNKIKVGEYVLHPGLSAQEILTLIISGKTRQYSITFPEGWDFKEILDRIKKNRYLNHTLNYQDLDYAVFMEMLGSEIPHPEGLFFPDTYYFDKNMTDISLLQRAYNKMQRVLALEWADRAGNLPLKTPYEALILASIVEKETAIESERPVIAGVFVRRLQKGMLLQTDPTVIYGMGGKFDGNIRSKDLRTHTAYNTYVIKGLPPTPIAMPGQKAIHAVLHPEQGGSLYFVARGDGSHVFSKTLNEHNKAVNIFQRKRK